MKRRNVLPRAGGGGYLLTAFTMAEILLSLTIIGVVAAITLPSLTGNINERTWNTQRKALYARMSQAIALMPSLNGYGTLRETTDSAGSTSIEDTAAETFVTAGLSKVLKINNICDNEHIEDCGIPAKFTNVTGEVISTIPNTLSDFNSLFTSQNLYKTRDTKAAAFETSNGESILVYYNPQCIGDSDGLNGHRAQAKMCANFVYDLNGTKGPNTVGKDIGFITALYPTDPVVVAPIPLSKDASSNIRPIFAGEKCTQMNPESRVPTRDELTAMAYNAKLVGIYAGYYISSTKTPIVAPTDLRVGCWSQCFHTGDRLVGKWEGSSGPLRCVKR